MRSSILILTASTAAVALFTASAPVLAANVDYRALSQKAYADAECSTVLMTADLVKYPGNNTMSTVAGTAMQPRNSACVLLQSYVRMPGAAIASRDIIQQQSGSISSPSAFASNLLPALRASFGEVDSANRAPGALAKSNEAYVLKTTDGKWRIAFNGNTYDLSWEPIEIRMNPVTHTPYATGANGNIWTPTFATTYQTWDAKGEAPVVRAIDSKGNLLVTSLVYDRLYDVWVNKKYVGRFSNVDRDSNLDFSDAASTPIYYPGYVRTFSEALAFDKDDHLVVYRQEGRVFTRTAYDLK
jgi:hypothetical protein